MRKAMPGRGCTNCSGLSVATKPPDGDQQERFENANNANWLVDD
jgi:hypothetical protein